jgi:hypothetical protein
MKNKILLPAATHLTQADLKDNYRQVFLRSPQVKKGIRVNNEHKGVVHQEKV